MRIVLAAVVGLLVAVLGRLSGATPVPAEGLRPSTVAALVGAEPAPLPADAPPCRTARDALAAEQARLAAATERTRFELELAQGVLVAREGVAQPWPDDVDPRARPDAVRAVVEAALAGVGGLVVRDVDCAEYPCLVTAEEPGVSDPDGTSNHPDADAALATTGLAHLGQITRLTERDADGHRHPVHTWALGDADHAGDDVGTRVSWRLDQLSRGGAR